MSITAVEDGWIPTSKHSSRLGEPVRLIVIHDTEGISTARVLGAFWNKPTTQASSHVGIDSAEILQYVPYDRAAWTLRNGNQESDNAELCDGSYAAWTREQWLTRRRLLWNTSRWVAARCAARNIPPRWLTPAEVAAAMVDDRHPGGVCMHWDYTRATGDGTHWDTGRGFPVDVVMADAARILGQGSPAPIELEDDDDMGAYERPLPTGPTAGPNGDGTEIRQTVWVPTRGSLLVPDTGRVYFNLVAGFGEVRVRDIWFCAGTASGIDWSRSAHIDGYVHPKEARRGGWELPAGVTHVNLYYDAPDPYVQLSAGFEFLKRI